MRAWLIFSAGLIAMAVRPEMYPLAQVSKSLEIWWIVMFSLGLVLDLNDAYYRYKSKAATGGGQ